MDIWIHAMQHESNTLPLFYPHEFESWANITLSHGDSDTRPTIHASEINDHYIYLSQQPPPLFLSHTYTDLEHDSG